MYTIVIIEFEFNIWKCALDVLDSMGGGEEGNAKKENNHIFIWIVFENLNNVYIDEQNGNYKYQIK